MEQKGKMKEAAEVFFLSLPKKEERKEEIPFPSLQTRIQLARRRLLAFFIDFCLIYGLSFALSRVLVLGCLSLLRWHTKSQELFSNIFMEAFSHIFPASLLFLSFVYYCSSTSKWGKTLGQSLLNIEVFTRNKEGEKLVPSLRQSLLRYIASLGSFFALGLPFFLGIYGARGRSFQDWASHTEVEETSSYPREVSITELQLFSTGKGKKAA